MRGFFGNNDGIFEGVLELEGICDWEEDGLDDVMRFVLLEIKKISYEYKWIIGFFFGDCLKLFDGEESGVYIIKWRDGLEFKLIFLVFDLLCDL